jgi:hypothetical protein
MFQGCTGLLLGDTRKPFQKFAYARSIFDILEQGHDGDACATENPSAADTFSGAFNSNAGTPVDHRMILFLALKVLNIPDIGTGNGYKRRQPARQQRSRMGKGQD